MADVGQALCLSDLRFDLPVKSRAPSLPRAELPTVPPAAEPVALLLLLKRGLTSLCADSNINEIDSLFHLLLFRHLM